MPAPPPSFASTRPVSEKQEAAAPPRAEAVVSKGGGGVRALAPHGMGRSVPHVPRTWEGYVTARGISAGARPENK